MEGGWEKGIKDIKKVLLTAGFSFVDKIPGDFYSILPTSLVMEAK